MNNFGELLKELRLSRKLTIEQLVDSLNSKYGGKISKSSISRWENGEADPKLEFVRLLADFFKVSGQYFLGEDNSEKTFEIKKIETIAAHIDDDVTEEEMEDIKKYIEFIKSQRG
ncbi:helix-turn-helix transcriptional regulator [Psychrobacillus sp.]|uniref:helix-turn-helix domain-containing protein n=1 Tax=Psychrobacillus sp. TaxID=1871623 RepID=UPI0028BF441D|nr:helix-turn-helix transcriptional regulator [Psychrobacillus sp.]